MSNLTKVQISHWLSYDLYTDAKLNKATELDYLTTIRRNLMTYLKPFFGANEKVGLVVHMFANANNPHLYYLTADYQVLANIPKLEQAFTQPGTTEGAAIAAPHNPPGGPPPPPAPQTLQGTELQQFDDSNYLQVEANTLVNFERGTMQAAGQAVNEAR